MPEVITKENPASAETPKAPLLKRLSKKTVLIAAGVSVFFLVAAVALLLSSGGRNTSQPVTEEPQTAESKTRETKEQEQVRKEVVASLQSLPNTFVYGAWRGEESAIISVDLASGKKTTLATLPLTIKNVNVLSPQELIYIDKTDDNDHGRQIVTYLLKEKKVNTTVKASEGYGIDDFILSPNKQYMAIWEVSLAPGKNVLQGGRSRVYGVKLSDPGTKHLIYDESAIGPVHYPRAVLNNGRIFMDSFKPNDPAGGAGWAYGMSVADINGANKKDIEQMQEGTYGTQPSLSPDGRYLVFGGYDGSRGDGKALSDDFRRALLTPTTVELLDTQTLSRTRLPSFTNSDIYPTVEWGATGNDIHVTVISKTQARDGLFSYDLRAQKLTRLELPDTEETYYSLVASLSPTKHLIATIDDSPTSLGNLGDTYAHSIQTLLYYDPSTAHAARIPIGDAYAQYITTLPSQYFQRVLGIAHAQGGDPTQPNVTVIDLYSNTASQENLQLKTFMLKPALNAKREVQQSNPIPTATPTPTPTATPTPPPVFETPVTPKPTKPPRVIPTQRPHNFVLEETINCRDLARKQCGNGWNSSKCVERKRVQLKEQGKCNQSPLYLYGAEGLKVNVQVLTTVYNDNPLYGTGYAVTLQEGGSMLVSGKSYQAINYDYRPNLRRLAPPARGTVARRADIEKVLRNYAKKMGLNEKETADLVQVGKTKIDSPYVFISFYDQKVSEKILPLSFMPQPDNYLNVVFYFKQLNEAPNFSPEQPVFPAPLKRSGFTAVEVSEIIE